MAAVTVTLSALIPPGLDRWKAPPIATEPPPAVPEASTVQYDFPAKQIDYPANRARDKMAATAEQVAGVAAIDRNLSTRAGAAAGGQHGCRRVAETELDRRR